MGLSERLRPLRNLCLLVMAADCLVLLCLPFLIAGLPRELGCPLTLVGLVTLVFFAGLVAALCSDERIEEVLKERPDLDERCLAGAHPFQALSWTAVAAAVTFLVFPAKTAVIASVIVGVWWLLPVYEVNLIVKAKSAIGQRERDD